MSKSDAFESAILGLIFNNTPIANLGDATGVRGSTAAGSLFLSLHTADPGEAGTQATNEISYTGYARQAVPRSNAGFTVAGDTATLANNVDFPEMTGGTGGTATHFALGYAAAGATVVAYKGTLNPTISVALAVTPRVKSGTTVTEA